MTDPRSELGDDAAVATAPEGQAWTPDRIAAERRRLDRQLLLLLAVLAIGFFGLLGYQYPTVRAPSRTTYEVVAQGRRWGTDWSGSFVQFLAHASDRSGIERELHEVAPIAQSFAAQNGDSLLELVAKRRLFRYGLFTIDQSYHSRFHREGTAWVQD